MNKKVITTILILLAVAIIPVYWLKLAFKIIPIRDGLYMITVITAVIASFFACFKYGIKHARSLTLLAIAGALVSELIAEFIFEYHYIILRHDIPFPSVEDLFSLLYYGLFFVGLINEIRVAHVNWKKLNKRILILPIIISLILICVVSYMGIYEAYDPTETLFANIVSMAYGVGDLLLIIISLFLIVLVKEYRGGKFARIWMFLLIGFIFNITADIFWSFYPTQYHDEVWFYKSFFDTASMLGYLCFAQMLFLFGFSISDAYKLVNIDSSKNAKPITLTAVPSTK